MSNTYTWNAEQQQAIDNTLFKKSFCLIGAAGTGKTTTLKGAVTAAMEAHRIPPLDASTKHLSAGAPGVALLSYTRRAVRNIAKQMPEFLKPHCLTFHKVLEFEPEYYEEENDEGRIVNKMRFAPQRHRDNPLPRTLSLVIVDEASMTSTDLFALFLAALPDPSSVQFIFLGDLNQLPPVYGQPVLGLKLLELPVVELTRVYRQALESPIISLALGVKDNNFATFNKDAETLWGAPRHWNAKEVTERISLNAPGRGKVTLVPWKKDFEAEVALKAVAGKIPQWVEEGFYDPEEDLMLCPWNLSFGTIELNKHIADTLAKRRNAKVWEIIAGFNKHYLAVGDRLMVEKQDALILDIYKNPKYLGVHPQMPSESLNRWGVNESGEKQVDIDTDVDIDELLAAHDATQIEDRTAQCSHIIKIRMIDTDEIVLLDKAAQLNNSSLGYAITVHKAQGSECRKVFFLTAGCHSAMLFRELVYTAITRAAEELVILMQPTMLARAAKRPRIKGDTLAAKLDFFRSRNQERIGD
jgi:ATP-dependent exoDNAse (exonuclease V) alpha subunit